MAAPGISIVVLSWNTADLLAACLRALRDDRAETTREIIVVDNASEDGSADMVARDFPEVRLIRNDANLLYAEGNNIGARAATGEFLCLLNSDTEVQPGALDTLRQWLVENPEYAVASPKLINFDGSIQRACQRFPGLIDAFRGSLLGERTAWARRRIAYAHMHDFDHLHSRDVEQPPGACMMLRREEYMLMDGLDTQLSLFFNDVDFCLRLRARSRLIRFIAEAEVKHHHGASTRRKSNEFGNALWQANRLAFYRKHHGWFGGLLVAILFVLQSAIIFARLLIGRWPMREKFRAIGRLGSYVRQGLAWRSA